MFPVGEFHYEIMNDLMLKNVYKQYEKMKVLMLNEKSHCINIYVITTFKINLKVLYIYIYIYMFIYIYFKP